MSTFVNPVIPLWAYRGFILGSVKRVSAVMRHLRALGADAELGCTVQQAIQQGRD